MTRLFAALLALAAPLTAQTWNTTDVALESAYQAALLVDWRQTSDIHRYPHAYERNPILGQHPSQSSINGYFAASALGHLAVSHLLSGKARTAWQGATIGVELYWVGRNKSLGLSVRW